MNDPSPFLAKEAASDSLAPGQSHMRIMLFIVAVHVVIFGVLLMIGCKKEEVPPEPPDYSGSAEGPFVPELPTPTPENQPDDFYRVGELPGPPPSEIPTPPGGGDEILNLEELPDAVLSPESTETIEYRVQSGDNLYRIRGQYGVSLDAIIAANPGLDPELLKPGQVLQIPKPSPLPPPKEEEVGNFHVVKSGENLTVIARDLGVTVSALKTANNLPSDLIRVGQKLKIPEGAADSPVNP